MKHPFIYALVFFATVLSVANCARKGTPSGGPIDSIAPVMVTANPSYLTTDFKSKKIKLSFDEYVKFKDLNKQLIVSPPMEQAPLIRPVGTASKTISIEIMDSLKKNTTYALHFGNSIVDNNEGNPLEGFKYVFSTGSYVDSLRLNGTVSHAFEQKMKNNTSLMLYEMDRLYHDSIVYKEKPDYVASTLDTTHFELTNIKAGTYQLIALNEQRKNYLFDPKQDQIAFVKDPIELPTKNSYHLRLFSEIQAFKIRRPLENKIGKIIFGYEGVLRPIKIQLVSKTPPEFKSFVSLEKDKDSLNYWYTPLENDSLQFRVTGQDLDTLFTVQLRTSKKDSLTLKALSARILHRRDTFALESNIPIESVNSSQIKLFEKDSLPIDFSARLDASKLQLSLDFQRKPEEHYSVEMLPNALVDFFGNSHDTLQYNIKTLSEEAYGTIEMTVGGILKYPLLAELYTEKKGLIERQSSTGNKRFVFDRLIPDTYLFRVIEDTNRNGKWDPGNFLKKQVPEKVHHFGQKIKLRANWTVNEVFECAPLETVETNLEKDSLF